MTYHMTPKPSFATLALGLSLALGAQVASTAIAKAATLDVEIHNLQNQKGKLMVGLYGNQADYEQNKPVRGLRVAIGGKNMKVQFDDLPTGTYALKLFHDENGNGKLDMSERGIPQEAFGFSNNAPANFGPAKWNDARFILDADAADQSVQMQRLSVR
jgi:uncharacterized protein (DUF2141 family)